MLRDGRSTQACIQSRGSIPTGKCRYSQSLSLIKRYSRLPNSVDRFSKNNLSRDLNVGSRTSSNLYHAS